MARRSRLDPELLATGDSRNVVDRYRYWTVEAIVADLDTRRFGFHVAIENLAHDFNIGSIVRTANAFQAASVQVVGRRRWNREVPWSPTATCTCTISRTRRRSHVSPGGDLPVIGVDNVPGSVPVESYELPARCVLFFGSESDGLSPDALSVCDTTVSIAQYGSTLPERRRRRGHRDARGSASTPLLRPGDRKPRPRRGNSGVAGSPTTEVNRCPRFAVTRGPANCESRARAAV